MAQGGGVNLTSFLNIPISIILGILLGAIVGYGLYLFSKPLMPANIMCETV